MSVLFMNTGVTHRFSFRDFFRSKSTILFPFLCLAGLGLRLFYCYCFPLYTTDLLRNIGYGKAFWDYGFTLYDITPFDLSPWPCQFLWPNHHYTYPPMTLLLFALIASIHTSIVWGKIVFTIFDALSAWIIAKSTGDRWLALLYWLNPISLWYSSREGQFEGYVVFWMGCALWALQRRKPWAFGLIGLAVQSKLFPACLGIWFVVRMSWKEPKRLLQECSWGLVSVLPTLLAAIWGGYPEHLMEGSYVPAVNPFSWTISDPHRYFEYPFWLILSHQLISIGFLFFCLYGMKRTGLWIPWIAPLLFVILLPFSQLAQFWYYILLPALCLPVEDRSLRRILFLWSMAFGLLSIYSILIGPIGYRNPPDAMLILQKAFWGF